MIAECGAKGRIAIILCKRERKPRIRIAQTFLKPKFPGYLCSTAWLHRGCFRLQISPQHQPRRAEMVFLCICDSNPPCFEGGQPQSRVQGLKCCIHFPLSGCPSHIASKRFRIWPGSPEAHAGAAGRYQPVRQDVILYETSFLPAAVRFKAGPIRERANGHRSGVRRGAEPRPGACRRKTGSEGTAV